MCRCIALHTTVPLPPLPSLSSLHRPSPLYLSSPLSTVPLPFLPSLSPLYRPSPLSTIPLLSLQSLSPLYRPSPSLLEAKLPYNVPELFLLALSAILWLLSWETEYLEERETTPSSPVPCHTQHATRDSTLITSATQYPACYQRLRPHHQYHVVPGMLPETAPSSPVPCRTQHATRDSALITSATQYPACYQRQYPHHRYHVVPGMLPETVPSSPVPYVVSSMLPCIHVGSTG